jgi:Transmembrane protein 43
MKMSDSFTETTSVSWFGRLRRSVGGVVIGLVLIIGMVALLFWNEGRAVTTARSLAEGAGAVVSVGADAVNAANEGKLVHVSGTVTTDSTPEDPDFAISAPGVRLVRNVEMFQWKEESHSETTQKLGGGEETVTTYTYSKEWDDNPIDSGAFKQPSGHQNPSMEVRSRSFQIPEGKLGAFMLDQPVLDGIGGDQPMAIKPAQTAAIEAAFGTSKKVSVVDGRIYLGWNPSSPAIGDYRVSYDVAPLGVISVIGQQQGERFQAYQTIAGDQLLMVGIGNVPAAQMFKEAADANRLITWLVRGIGLLLLAVGFGLFMSPLAVIADFIPPLGSVVRMGTGLVAFLLAIVVGTITIAIAWFYYRPVLAIGILAVGAVVAAGVIYIGRSRRQAAQAPTAPATPA